MRTGEFVGLTIYAGAKKESLFIGGEITYRDKDKNLIAHIIDQIIIDEKREHGFYEIFVYVRENKDKPLQTIRCKPEMLTIHHY